MELNDLQFSILDALYFVEPYAHILEEVKAPENIIGAELKTLLAQRWVQAMRYDPVAKDFVTSHIYDTDDMHAYHYLATREGLLKHAGRR